VLPLDEGTIRQDNDDKESINVDGKEEKWHRRPGKRWERGKSCKKYLVRDENEGREVDHMLMKWSQQA
jgi:hypothetical protein